MTGFALCGSFCNMEKAFRQLENLVNSGEKVIPIMSYNVYSTDTRFGKASELIAKVEDLCGEKVVHTLPDANLLFRFAVHQRYQYAMCLYISLTTYDIL